MPTYVYECSDCGSVFEKDQRIIEDPLDTCIPCGAKGTVKRLIQPTAVMFKGSGFYINDSVKATPPSAEKTATPETTETAAPPATSSPAETPE